MPPFGCLALLFFFGLLILFPIFLADVMLLALAKLGLSGGTSLLAVLGIFFGGMVNIPLKKIPRNETVEATPFGLFGIERMFPGLARQSTHTIIAVNVGGCIVPCLIAAYELIRIAGQGPWALTTAVGAATVNVLVCHRLARPIPHVGIALPALIPALVAAALGLIFLPQMAPPVAFIAGVLGPLIGADLLHLGDLQRISTGVASIGGAGTFDGIVLSSLVATLLA